MSIQFRAHPGVALLDAIVAVAVLATMATAALGLSAESVRALSLALATERENQEANAFLHAVALWDAATLDQRLGTRRQGPWLLQIERPNTGLYTVALADSAGARTILATVLYRSAERLP